MRQRRQKAHQGGRLQKSRARRIGHQHLACPDRLQQARHTQGGVGAQFQWVQVLVINPLEQAVHRHQALEGFEEKRLVAHDQVAAFDQAQAQVARQVSVLKISLVVGAGRQQGQVGIFPGRAAAFQAVHQGAVGAGQPLDPKRLKGLRKLARDRQAVFKQVAQAGRRLAALAHQPPVAVGAMCQVKGGDVQPHAAHRFHAVHGAQVARVALHQCRW